jgi:hypothetical protein
VLLCVRLMIVLQWKALLPSEVILQRSFDDAITHLFFAPALDYI